MEVNSEISLLIKIVVIIFLIVMHYGYFYFLHKVYGTKLYDVRRSSRTLSFKTNKSLYQIDKKHQKLLYKKKKEKHWKSVGFEEINGIHVVKSTGTASVIEFFFGDFSLFDFFRKYRDRLHTYEIKIEVISGHQDINMDVTILSLKQYEQREFWLGQLIHDLDIWVMTKLGFYVVIDEVYEENVDKIMRLFKTYGLPLNFR